MPWPFFMLGLDFSGSDATEWLSVKTTGSGRPLDSLTGRGGARRGAGAHASLVSVRRDLTLTRECRAGSGEQEPEKEAESGNWRRGRNRRSGRRSLRLIVDLLLLVLGALRAFVLDQFVLAPKAPGKSFQPAIPMQCLGDEGRLPKASRSAAYAGRWTDHQAGCERLSALFQL